MSSQRDPSQGGPEALKATETSNMLTLCAAQIDGALGDCDAAIERLLEAFTTIVEDSQWLRRKAAGLKAEDPQAAAELDMCTCWNGRAQTVIDEGAPVAISWNQGLMSYDGWCIAKGSPTADIARQFIKFASIAQRQAAFTPYAAYGPTNPNAMKFVDAARAKTLPSFPENAKLTVPTSPAYWGPTQTQLLERFNQWMLS